MRAGIEQAIKDSIAAKQAVLAQLVPLIEKTGQVLVEALKKGSKILICGNGGSAADAQHFAAELIGRYEKERGSLPAIALTTDTSSLTAIGNDYGYEEVFARQVAGLGSKGDVLVAISTSGKSPNILKAIDVARQKGVTVIGLTGRDGGLMKDLPIASVVVPSQSTSRIQECHIMIIHIWCRLIEDSLSI